MPSIVTSNPFLDCFISNPSQVSSSVVEMCKAKVSKEMTTLDEMLCMDTADLYADMKQRQTGYVSPSSYNPEALFVSSRRHLVDWMTSLGEQMHLHTSTIHCAVLYLDKLLRSPNQILQNEWIFFATCCLSLAAKYEEMEEHCPLVPELLAATKLNNLGHTSLSFRNGELEVLRVLGWNLRAIPALHVVNYFLAKIPVFADDRWNKQRPTTQVFESVKKFAVFFSNLCLQQYSFQKYFPTHLAAAILLASRFAVKLEPRWRPELVQLTGYEEWEISVCFHHVWEHYASQFPNHISVRSASPRGVVGGP